MGKISTMLFIYDKEGTIIATHNANNCVPPVGVPWVVADIPDGCIVYSPHIYRWNIMFRINTVFCFILFQNVCIFLLSNELE